jgi:hypothetical protein
VTLKLLGLVQRQWDSFDGWFISGHRVDDDPWDLPPHRFWSTVYYWATKDADPESIAKWERKLWVPPPGYQEPITEGPWTADAEMSAFRNLAASLNIDTRPKEDSA